MKLLKSHIYFKVLSKDLNYQFEGEKVYCQLHIIKDLSLSPVALKKLSFKICCKFLTSDQKRQITYTADYPKIGLKITEYDIDVSENLAPKDFPLRLGPYDPHPTSLPGQSLHPWCIFLALPVRNGLLPAELKFKENTALKYMFQSVCLTVTVHCSKR